MLTKEEMPACPVATTVALIGSKWKLLIMRNLLSRPWRFNELKKDLEERILREAGGNGTASRQDQASGHETAVMAFMSIDDAADFCRESQYGGEVTSSFYKGKKDGFYYLFIQRSDMDIRDFSRLCFTAAEFGKVGEFTKAGKAYLLSLCDVLIGDDAYAKLRSIGK